MACMRRLGKCWSQSCSLCEACSSVTLSSQSAKKHHSKYTFYKQECSLLGLEWYQTACCDNHVLYLNFFFLGGRILRSLFSGNSDLQSRNTILSDEVQNKVIRLMAWQPAVLQHLFKLPGEKTDPAFVLVAFFIGWAEYQWYCWTYRGEV